VEELARRLVSEACPEDTLLLPNALVLPLEGVAFLVLSVSLWVAAKAAFFIADTSRNSRGIGAPSSLTISTIGLLACLPFSLESSFEARA